MGRFWNPAAHLFVSCWTMCESHRARLDSKCGLKPEPQILDALYAIRSLNLEAPHSQRPIFRGHSDRFSGEHSNPKALNPATPFMHKL